jgi:methyltransferase (TIGR00027 family)
MKLPNLSESMYVGRLRYIQSVHEPAERRGPDTLVRYFIPTLRRWRAAWLRPDELARLRGMPFYYYLLARTRYYDQVVTDAIQDGVKRIVIVGCGSDTRAYRFKDSLRTRGIRVLECDQPDAIHIKQQMTERWRDDRVEYLAIDLNDDLWPALGQWLGDRSAPKTLVMMEGVSPYVDETGFRGFLAFLANTLSAGSHVAYDFKIRGVDDQWGQGGRTRTPFRLSLDVDDLAAFHDAIGLRLEHSEWSADLNGRLLPGLVQPATALFKEDCLLRLRVR